MSRACLLLSLAACATASAQDAPDFAPPQPHPVARYEAGWKKNPFMRKTAPAAVANAAFAQDLAIGTYFGAVNDPTIVIVNTKTQERIKLRKGETAANGMTLAEVSIGLNRKETFAQVSMAGEVARLHINEALLQQITTAAAPTNAKPVPGPKTPAQPAAAAQRFQSATIKLPILPKLPR